jgi:hypothetical protein
LQQRKGKRDVGQPPLHELALLEPLKNVSHALAPPECPYICSIANS